MPLDTQDLKGCWLVWYPVGVTGGCTYSRTNPKTESKDGVGEESRWESTKVVDDVAEHKAANALRNMVKRYIRKMGAPAAPGIVLVPLEDEEELDVLRADLHRKVDDFNADAVYSKVNFRCFKYRIEGENEEVLQDMLVSLRSTLEELRQAEKAADFKGIRSVVQRLGGFSAVLPDRAADYLQRAIADATAQATAIRASLQKKGNDLATVQKEISTSAVDFARFSVMEPGNTLPDVDNALVTRMVEAQAAQRLAGVELSGEASTVEAPDFGQIATSDNRL